MQLRARRKLEPEWLRQEAEDKIRAVDDGFEITLLNSANLKAIVGKGGVRPGEAEARPSIGLTRPGCCLTGELVFRQNIFQRIFFEKYFSTIFVQSTNFL